MNDTNQPAFPVVANNWHRDGMTLREYAAIQLKVPSSGNEELDALIWESMRNDFAAKAMQAIYAAQVEWQSTDCPADAESLQVMEDVAGDAYAMADAMLRAREQ